MSTNPLQSFISDGLLYSSVRFGGPKFDCTPKIIHCAFSYCLKRRRSSEISSDPLNAILRGLKTGRRDINASEGQHIFPEENRYTFFFFIINLMQSRRGISTASRVIVLRRRRHDTSDIVWRRQLSCSRLGGTRYPLFVYEDMPPPVATQIWRPRIGGEVARGARGGDIITWGRGGDGEGRRFFRRRVLTPNFFFYRSGDRTAPLVTPEYAEYYPSLILTIFPFYILI